MSSWQKYKIYILIQILWIVITGKFTSDSLWCKPPYQILSFFFDHFILKSQITWTKITGFFSPVDKFMGKPRKKRLYMIGEIWCIGHLSSMFQFTSQSHSLWSSLPAWSYDPHTNWTYLWVHILTCGGRSMYDIYCIWKISAAERV